MIYWKSYDYLNDRALEGKEAIEFDFASVFPEGSTILFAYNESYGYEEQCFVLWREVGGRLAMVETGHCSCYGYEGAMSEAEYIVPKQLAMANWRWITDGEARDCLNALIGELVRLGE